MATQPTEKQRADLSLERGRQAAKMTDQGEKKRYAAESGKIDTNYDDVARSTAIIENKQKRQQVMGSFKHGGTVPATGNYKLHKGEKVTPAPTMSPDYSRMDKSNRDFDQKLATAETYKVQSGLVKGYMKHGPNDNMIRGGSSAIAPHDKDH